MILLKCKIKIAYTEIEKLRCGDFYFQYVQNIIEKKYSYIIFQSRACSTQ